MSLESEYLSKAQESLKKADETYASRFSTNNPERKTELFREAEFHNHRAIAYSLTVLALLQNRDNTGKTTSLFDDDKPIF